MSPSGMTSSPSQHSTRLLILLERLWKTAFLLISKYLSFLSSASLKIWWCSFNSRQFFRTLSFQIIQVLIRMCMSKNRSQLISSTENFLLPSRSKKYSDLTLISFRALNTTLKSLMYACMVPSTSGLSLMQILLYIFSISWFMQNRLATRIIPPNPSNSYCFPCTTTTPVFKISCIGVSTLVMGMNSSLSSIRQCRSSFYFTVLGNLKVTEGSSFASWMFIVLISMELYMLLMIFTSQEEKLIQSGSIIYPTMSAVAIQDLFIVSFSFHLLSKLLLLSFSMSVKILLESGERSSLLKTRSSMENRLVHSVSPSIKDSSERQNVLYPFHLAALMSSLLLSNTMFSSFSRVCGENRISQTSSAPNLQYPFWNSEFFFMLAFRMKQFLYFSMVIPPLSLKLLWNIKQVPMGNYMISISSTRVQKSTSKFWMVMNIRYGLFSRSTNTFSFSKSLSQRNQRSSLSFQQHTNRTGLWVLKNQVKEEIVTWTGVSYSVYQDQPQPQGSQDAQAYYSGLGGGWRQDVDQSWGWGWGCWWVGEVGSCIGMGSGRVCSGSGLGLCSTSSGDLLAMLLQILIISPQPELHHQIFFSLSHFLQLPIMEHSFQSAFVTSSHPTPSKSKTASQTFRAKPRPFDDKQRKKRMEEIHTSKRNIQDYLHHLSSFSQPLMTKALQNLSLNPDILSIKLIDLPRAATEAEILCEVNFLQKALLKLNSLAKEVKKVGRYRASLVSKRIERESKISCIQHDLEMKELNNSMFKSKTLEERSFNHMKLLYQKELGEQLRRREREEEMMARQQKTKEILRENDLNKRKEKRKKEEELKEKRRVFYEGMKSKQAEQLQKVEKKMGNHEPGDAKSGRKDGGSSEKPKLFTKILSFNKNVQANKMVLEEQERKRLEKLELSLQERHHTNLINRETERANKTAKGSKDASIQNALERKLNNQKQKEAYFLSTLIGKMRWGRTEVKPEVKKQEKSQKSVRCQSETPWALPSVAMTPNHSPKKQEDRIRKKALILQQLSENLHQKNQRSQVITSKNKQKMKLQEQSRIQTLNTIYHIQKLKTNEAHQQRKKKENKHIHSNFKTRCRQDQLHFQLNKILTKPLAQELESTLNYIDSGRCRMFQSKQ